MPVLHSLSNLTLAEGKEYMVKTTRPLPDSGIRHFGQHITQEQWDLVEEEGSPEEQEAALQEVLTAMLDKSCPTKTVKLRPQIDKSFITQEMKTIDRQRRREYRKLGKTQKYSRLKDKFDRKFKSAAQTFLDRTVRSLQESEPGKAYKILKRMGAQPGDNPADGSFV